MFEKENLTRQLDIIDCSVLNDPITIVGAGAVGSCTAMSLAKMGFSNIRVIDYDKIEYVNMNNQFYKFSDVGRKKVEALSDIVREFANLQISILTKKYVKEKYEGIVISAVDSMNVRKKIWKNHKGNSGTKLIIDPRMSAEFAVIHTVDPNNVQQNSEYQNTLYSDNDSVREACTAKATMYTAFLLGGQVAKIVKDFLCNENNKHARFTNWNIKENAYESYT